jgi:mannose-6-phosphate isomerase-like protein (cupin superfamily)
MHFSLEDAVARLPGPEGERFVSLFTRGTLAIELYAPRDNDAQVPHRHDEVYFVARGSGIFCRAKERYRFAPGDLLFVPAFESHQFQEFTDDLVVWVIFYGPDGGEIRPSTQTTR